MVFVIKTDNQISINSLLVIEPNLRTSSGHYADFVKALGSRLPADSLEVFAHPDADVMLEEMHGVRVCKSSPRTGDMFSEWLTINSSVSKEQSFLILTADNRHAAAASFASRFSGKNPVSANFFFHRAPTTWRDNLLQPLTAITREYSQAITSTEMVADSLKALGWRRVEYVPYPVLPPDLLPDPRLFSHLLMAGAARLNKGLDLVADLASKWAGEGRNIPLLVQVSKKHRSRHGRRESQYVEKLLSSGYIGLHTDEISPCRADYLERFKGALVLAPYEREQFSSQVSGVILDALLNGAPVIATKGTWSAIQVQRFGAGITIAERSISALEIAIDTILADWSSYSQRACEASKTLALEHDPINLANLLGLNNE
ncbi:MAG: hypothetical protein HXX17_02950 [Geobacteraceae bacterium]|nr:hypothetical protein [Geobacteraceae bacterium]